MSNYEHNMPERMDGKTFMVCLVHCTMYSVHTFYKVLADFDNIGTGHMKNAALHARGSVHRL